MLLDYIERRDIIENKIIEYKICYNRISGRGDDMNKKFSALDIANWFIWYNKVEQIDKTIDDDDLYEGLTHLKVQKLLYYADGICLAINDDSLFDEKIYAWQHGPVVKEVYKELSVNGREEIPFDDNNISVVDEINSNDELSNILITTYDNYAGYTAWQLREKIHVPGSPLQITVDSTGLQSEIKPDLIKKYF